MNDTLVAVKAAIVAGVTAVSAFLGWRGILAVAWVIAILLDYVTGTAAACKDGEWSSQTARQGLWHKAGMIAVVLVSAVADGVMAVMCANLALHLEWPGIVLPLVLAWYIITELGSILENAVKLGAAVPGWLTKMLKASLSAVDQAAGSGEAENKNDKEENK